MLSRFIPILRAARIEAEYAGLLQAANKFSCILSIAGMTLVMQGVSVENSSVTVLNICGNERLINKFKKKKNIP